VGGDTHPLQITHCSQSSRRLTGRTLPLELDNCSILSKLTIQLFLLVVQISTSRSPCARDCSRTSEWHQDMLRQVVVRTPWSRPSSRVNMYCQSVHAPPLSKAGRSLLRRCSTSGSDGPRGMLGCGALLGQNLYPSPRPTETPATKAATIPSMTNEQVRGTRTEQPCGCTYCAPAKTNHKSAKPNCSMVVVGEVLLVVVVIAGLTHEADVEPVRAW